MDFLINKIKEINPLKTSPHCKHFGICNSCTLQDIDYQSQLELKKEWLIYCLKKEGLDCKEINIKDIYGSPSIYFYRNKMEFAFGLLNKNIILGLRESNLKNRYFQKKVIPLEECPIFSPKVKDIFFKILRFVSDNNFSVYDPYRKKGFLRHLVLRESKNTQQIMLCLVTRNSESFNKEDFLKFISSNLKELKSIYWVKNDALSDVVNYNNKELIYGDSFIEETLDKFKFKIYPETFFQPNTEAAELLYQKIQQHIKESNSRILSLYCGAGVMEIYISKNVNSITAIDIAPINIKTAIENSELNNIKNLSFLCGRVEKLFEIIKPMDFNYLIVDPPRSGISPRAIKKIIKLNIPTIIYVSCNPLSLAKDLVFFKNNGYNLNEIYAFDFTPHIFHLESMAILNKSHI